MKSSSAEQKIYREKVREMRNEIVDKKKNDTSSSDTSQSDQFASKDLEPDILNCTNIPSYDLKLFQEAQAVASEKIVSIFILHLVIKYFYNITIYNQNVKNHNYFKLK